MTINSNVPERRHVIEINIEADSEDELIEHLAHILTVAKMTGYLKRRVDAELSEDMPWGEFSKNDNGELVIDDGTK